MNGILLTFTLILLYSRISWAGAPQGTRTCGATTWSFSRFLNFLRFFFYFVASKALPTTLVILSAAFEALSTAYEAFSATVDSHSNVFQGTL